jgi:hypothetical protein
MGGGGIRDGHPPASGSKKSGHPRYGDGRVVLVLIRLR